MQKRTRIFSQAMVVVVGLTGAALAVGTAQADVARYQTQSAVLTVSLEPQYTGNIHVYDITINPCDGSFTGVADATNNVPGETITGTLSGGNTNVNFTAQYPASAYQWFGSGPLAGFTGGDNISNVFTTLNGSVTTPTNVSTWKNHGAFVSASPDKNDAAHSCIGMPINSNK